MPSSSAARSRPAAPVESLYVSPAGADDRATQEVCRRAGAAGARVFPLAAGVLERVADTVTPQPVLAVLPMLEEPPAGADAWTAGPGSLIVVLVDVRDPGNAGTVLRAADASGSTAVVFAGDSRRPVQPQDGARLGRVAVPRPPRGAARPARALASELSAAGFRTLGSVVREGEDYAELDWSVPTALFLGNESSGLDPDLCASLSGSLAIPMAGRAESLNVGVACAVVCFEAFRQRRGGGAGARSISGGGKAHNGD